MHLVHDLIRASAQRDPGALALRHGADSLDYGGLSDAVERAAAGLLALGLTRRDRVAVYLEKRLETVVGLFAATMAGGTFVPVNPQLKVRQVSHILRDCNVRVLITSQARLDTLSDVVADCPDLTAVVVVDAAPAKPATFGGDAVSWSNLRDMEAPRTDLPRDAVETDMAAILYTSGSTGLPKGVVLSHRNLVAGALSVSQYLENRPSDRILSVLPLSFDAGLSQLTTAFSVGAGVVLLNYLLPRDVVRCCSREAITGITAVPPLWIQLASQDWPPEAGNSLRYFANTGGHMPRATLGRLRQCFPQAKPYLMYGLTEAFRSTYLDPAEVDPRPDSIGKAVPNAEVIVVRPDGSLCEPGEPGELVHRGPFVALGYWNDAARTAERFRPPPGAANGIDNAERAVWSGDQVRRDEEGFLYFVGRADDMIKTSGYRVSPTELEEVLYASGLVGEAVALGIGHPVLGQAIVIVATPPDGMTLDSEGILARCRVELPNYMVPHHVVGRDTLPRNANGKIDRRLLADELDALFRDEAV